MIDWKSIVDSDGMSALYGAVGHFSRLASGQVRVDWKREIPVLIFSSLPVGVLAGGLAAQWGFVGYIPYIAAFVAGLLSQMIIKNILENGPKGIIDFIRGGGK